MSTEPTRINVADVFTEELDRGVSPMDTVRILVLEAMNKHESCGLRNTTFDCDCYPDDIAPCGEMSGSCQLQWPCLPDEDDMVELANDEGWDYLTTDEKPDEPITTKEATAFMDGAKAAMGERDEVNNSRTRNPCTDDKLRDMWEDGYNFVAGDVADES